MLGAIIGDLAGTKYEYQEFLDWKNRVINLERRMEILDLNDPLLTDKSFISDDSILTIAVVNFKPDAGQKIENLRRMKGFAAAASKRGSDLILFPEMCLMGYDYYISQQKHWMETAQKQWLRFQKNMEITTTALNGTIVKNGETFSFCNTIGPSTSSKGYLEADIYDHNGNKKKGYGGGNCQVSSTLYNAVLAVPSLTVTERHPHSNHVPYVPNDKDAAVAYGSYDFKFKNNSGNDIKILSSVTTGLVNVTLLSLKAQ